MLARSRASQELVVRLCPWLFARADLRAPLATLPCPSRWQLLTRRHLREHVVQCRIEQPEVCLSRRERTACGCFSVAPGCRTGLERPLRVCARLCIGRRAVGIDARSREEAVADDLNLKLIVICRYSVILHIHRRRVGFLSEPCGMRFFEHHTRDHPAVPNTAARAAHAVNHDSP